MADSTGQSSNSASLHSHLRQRSSRSYILSLGWTAGIFATKARYLTYDDSSAATENYLSASSGPFSPSHAVRVNWRKLPEQS